MNSSLSIRSSATIIGSDDNLCMEILVFLPARSLIRFQLVSKQWFSVISSPPFRHLHTLHHHRRPKPQTSFLLRASDQYESQHFICRLAMNKLVRYRFRFPLVKVLQSCNGLLLLECRDFYQRPQTYYICNPATMQYRNLLIDEDFNRIGLIFDPSDSPHYKVFLFKDAENGIKVRVYDSESHRWNDKGEYIGGPSLLRGRDHGIFWNGGIYFISPNEHSLWCFSPVNETFNTIPHPHEFKLCDSYTPFESEGYLYSVMWASDCIIYVGELDKVDSRWSWKCSVDLKRILAPFNKLVLEGPAPVGFISIFTVERAEAILLFQLPGKIMMYRFYDEVFEVLVDFRREKYCAKGPYLTFSDDGQFVESLAPV